MLPTHRDNAFGQLCRSTRRLHRYRKTRTPVKSWLNGVLSERHGENVAPDFNTASPSALTRSSCVNAPKCARDGTHRCAASVRRGRGRSPSRTRASRLQRRQSVASSLRRQRPRAVTRAHRPVRCCALHPFPLSFFTFVSFSSRRSLSRVAVSLVSVSSGHREPRQLRPCRVTMSSRSPRLARTVSIDLDGESHPPRPTRPRRRRRRRPDDARRGAAAGSPAAELRRVRDISPDVGVSAAFQRLVDRRLFNTLSTSSSSSSPVVAE